MLFRIALIVLMLIFWWLPETRAQTIAFEGFQIEEGGYIKYNFKQFYKGRKQKLRLIIKNIGDQPLKLEELELGCDCLKAKKLPKLPIPVGAKTKIQIVQKAKYRGAFDVFAKLKSNAKNHPVIWIKLEGEVLSRP